MAEDIKLDRRSFPSLDAAIALVNVSLESIVFLQENNPGALSSMIKTYRHNLSTSKRMIQYFNRYESEDPDFVQRRQEYVEKVKLYEEKFQEIV